PPRAPAIPRGAETSRRMQPAATHSRAATVPANPRHLVYLRKKSRTSFAGPSSGPFLYALNDLANVFRAVRRVALLLVCHQQGCFDGVCRHAAPPHRSSERHQRVVSLSLRNGFWSDLPLR